MLNGSWNGKLAFQKAVTAFKVTHGNFHTLIFSQLKKINELCNKVDYDLKQSNISIDNAVNLVVMTILNI